MAINRELMHVPGELDRAGRTGRLMVRAALVEATQELTQLSAAMTEIRSLSETTQVRPAYIPPLACLDTCLRRSHASSSLAPLCVSFLLQAWSERLKQWTDPESLKRRCGEMVKQVNDLEVRAKQAQPLPTFSAIRSFARRGRLVSDTMALSCLLTARRRS